MSCNERKKKFKQVKFCQHKHFIFIEALVSQTDLGRRGFYESYDDICRVAPGWSEISMIKIGKNKASWVHTKCSDILL